MEGAAMATSSLELLSLIGFDGNPLNGMVVHPDGVHLVYPLGNAVVAYNWATKKQRFFTGHDSIVSSVAVSKSGKYVGAGYVLSLAYVWDFGTGNVIASYTAHVNRVESVAFSCCETYLVSLGGLDDGSVVVYDIGQSNVLCIDPSVRPVVDRSTVLRTLHLHGENFVVAGENILRLWAVDREHRCLHRADALLAKIRRVIMCTVIDLADECAYCGTSTGDILKVRLHFPSAPSASSASSPPPPAVRAPTLAECFGKYPPASSKKRGGGGAAVVLYSKGITALYLMADGATMVVGTGAGLVELTRQRPQPREPDKKHRGRPPTPSNTAGRLATPTRPLLVAMRSVAVGSRVTSLQMMGDALLLVGTADCELFAVGFHDFSAVRMFTCHTFVVYDMAFPRDYSRVFATTSRQDVRVWSVDTMQELLRVTVRNCTCSGVVFAHDGSQIVTSWCDGRVRAFAPETGRSLYTIENCHSNGVSAVAAHPDGRRLLSGGGDGRLCVWRVVDGISALVAVLKDHYGMVSAIDVHRRGERAVSSSADGTCVIWDLVRYVRIATIFTNTVLTDVQYHPNDVEIIVCGTNGYIGYWDAINGSSISHIESSSGSAINSLHVTPAGNYFVTGSTDQVVEVWLYKEGKTTHVGTGHAGAVTNVRVSPDCKFMVSTSVDGGIFLWRFPYSAEMEPPSDRDSVTDVTGDAISAREQQTERSRQLSQKKSMSARKENIRHISKAQKIRADANSGNCPVAAGGGGQATTGGGSVKCLCPRGTTCNCGDANKNRTPGVNRIGKSSSTQ